MRFLLPCFVAIAASTAACHDATPGTDTPAPASNGGTDPRCSNLLYEVPASCRACEEAECCQAIMRCEQSSDCELLHECIAACPPSQGEACPASCATRYPNDTAEYDTMVNCFAAAVRCDTVCRVADAGPDDASDASPDAAD